MRSAFVLLEVVIAFGLLAIGMTIIGIQIHDGFMATHQNDQMFRAMMLADSRMAQIDSLAVEFDAAQLEAGEPIEEDFGGLFPEFASRLYITPTAVVDLYSLRLQILFDRERHDIEKEFEFDDAGVVLTTYTLRAKPTTIDLQADFGASEEQAIKITESFPEGDFDPTAFDPAILAKLDLEELVAVLPDLLDALGISLEQASRMVPPEVLQMLQDAGFGMDNLGGGGDQGAGEDRGGGEDRGSDEEG